MEVKVVSVSYYLEKVEHNTFRAGLKLLNKLRGSKNTTTEDDGVLLLQKVSMQLKPGSVTALMGLGNGHKCLLDCIALKQKDGLMSGKIQYDGAVRKNEMFKDIVLINDIGITHFHSLSVFDYLYYGARLRISHGVIECRERARLAARVVGLEGNTKIGNLSPSGIRILSIAAELVGNPTLICLIDPMEGLDASNQYDVMKVLWAISKRLSMPTTIVYNVSSLDEELLRMVDQVNFFVGNTIEFCCHLRDYSSAESSKKVAQHIKQISLVTMSALKQQQAATAAGIFPFTLGASSEALLNVEAAETDYIHSMAMLAILDSLKRVTDSGEPSADRQTSVQSGEGSLEGAVEYGVVVEGSLLKFAQSVAAARKASYNANQSIRHQEEFYNASRRLGEAGLPVRYKKSLRKEFSILFSRSFRYHMKNRTYWRLGVIRFIAAGFLIGGLVYGSGDHLNDQNLLHTPPDGLEDDDAYNVTSALFLVVALSVIGTSFTVPFLHSNVQLLKFEVESGLQTTVGSWMSMVLIDVPTYLLASACLALIVFNLIDIQGSPAEFFGAIFMVTLSGYSLAAVCAVWFPSQKTSSFVFAVFSAFCLVFSGYLQVVPELSGVWTWASRVAFTRWAFESLMINAFKDANDGDDFLSYYGFDNRSASFCNTWLFAWFAALQLLVLFGLTPTTSKFRLTSSKQLQARQKNMSSTTVTGSEVVHKYQHANVGGVGEDDDDEVVFTNPVHTVIPSIQLKPEQQSRKKKISESIREKGLGLESSYVPLGDGMGGDPGTQKRTELNTVLLKGLEEEQVGGVRDILLKPEGFSAAEQVPLMLPYTEAIKPVVISVPKFLAATLTFNRVKFTPRAGLNSDGFSSAMEPKLKGISGCLTPGTFSCIVSSDGDRAAELLLKVLAGRSKAEGKTTGVILANDQRLGRGKMYTNAAYVQKGDVPFISSLTVREVLRYSMYLRCTKEKRSPGGSSLYRNSVNSVTSTLSSIFKSDIQLVESNNWDGAGEGKNEDYQVIAGDLSLPDKMTDIEERINDVIQMIGLESVADCVVGEVCNRNSNKGALTSILSSNRNARMHRTAATAYRKFSLYHQWTLARTYLNQSLEILLNVPSPVPPSPHMPTQQRPPQTIGLTPAQMRCLSIGVELVTRPGLIFLEDPTIGLEWHESQVVSQMLRSLSKGGRTVVCSYSRPSMGVIESCSDILLLGGGLMVYSGPVESLGDYFDNIGFERMPGQNSLEYALDVAAARGKMGLVGGKRGITLSPEDLADLNRSLANIKSGTSAPPSSVQSRRGSKHEENLEDLVFAHNSDDDDDDVEYDYGPPPPANGFRRFSARTLFSGDTWSNPNKPVETRKNPEAGGWSTFGFNSSPAAPETNSVVSSQDQSKDSVFPFVGGEEDSVVRMGESVESGISTNSSVNPIHASAKKGINTPIGNYEKHQETPTNKSNYRIGKKSNIPNNQSNPSRIIPKTRVLLLRGFRTLLGDRKKVFLYFVRSLVAGMLLGSIWFQLDNGHYEARISVLATAYLVFNLFLVDFIEGIYLRKEAFSREASVGASGFFAYFLSESVPSYVELIFGSAFFVSFFYWMTGLRDSFGSFLYLFLMLLGSVFCNFNLQHILTMFCKSQLICKMVFTGVILPLQFLMSGYSVLISTMPEWISWGSFINPMAYYMAGVFKNELDDNDTALDGISYSALSDQFSYHLELWEAIVSIFVMGLIYRVIWLCYLKWQDLMTKRTFQRKVQSCRRRFRRFSVATSGNSVDEPAMQWKETFGIGKNSTGTEDQSLAELEFGYALHIP